MTQQKVRTSQFMPVLLNPKHERFAQGLANGANASKAYVLAWYKPDRHHASALRYKPDISRRVAELLRERERITAQSTAKAIKATALTKEWVIGRLIENADHAMQAQPGS
jgi:phage terminase small subunit